MNAELCSGKPYDQISANPASDFQGEKNLRVDCQYVPIKKSWQTQKENTKPGLNLGNSNFD